MKTKHFVAAIEAAFLQAYENETHAMTVPYLHAESGEIRECLGFLLTKTEHFAVIASTAAHWIAEDPDNVFDHENADESMDGIDALKDVLEDFRNLIGGLKVAPYMQWSCVYFPGLTEEQVLGESEAGHDPMLVTDTAVGRNPITGTMEN